MSHSEEQKFIFKRDLLRVSLLIVALFVISTWINYHLEKFEIVSWVIGVISGLYGLGLLLDQVATEKDRSTLKGYLQEGLKLMISNPILIGLYLVILFVGNLVSTVSVSTGGMDIGESTVVLGKNGSTEGGDTSSIGGSDDVKSFIAFTNPFGSNRYLDVEMYSREHFRLFPWVGKTIVISDLTPAPSILFRAPRRVILLDSAFYVFKYHENLDTVLIKEGKCSLLVGIDQTVPSSFKNEWREEMLQLVTADDVRAELYNSWKHNNVLPKDLKPGVEFHLMLFNKSKTLLHESKSVVSSMPFQDILLELK